MATKEQVQALLDRGLDYAAAGRELGIPAGQAYMLATGVPADGSGTAPDQEREPHGDPPSRQDLANPPAHNPTRQESVQAWIKDQAEAEKPDGGR